DLQDQTFDYVPLFAYHYGKKTIDNFGIFKNSFDPQREFNDWHNRTADIINKTAAQTVGMKPSQLLNPKEVENYGSMTGGIVKFKDDADVNKDYVRYPAADFPRGSDVMQREAMDLIPKILGITPNQMGFSETKQEPAQLFGMRVRQATKALAVIYNNISRSKKRRSDKVLKLIQLYYDRPHVFKVLIKEDMTQRDVFINMKYGDQVINDITIGEYEVIMDDLERNPTARALRWELKNQLVGLILQHFGPAAVDPEWWLKDSDLGDVNILIDRINQSIMGMIQSGQQMEAFDAADRLIDAANKRGIPLSQGSAQNKQPTNTSKQGTRQ
ncbi:MAG: portal protein, partial [Planctomycetota bacterium]